MSKELNLALKKLKENSEAIRDVQIDGIIHHMPLTSPNLNYLLGGGLARGRIHTLIGAESSGKTIIASRIAGEVQKQKEFPNVVLFIDMEHAFDLKYAANVGLDSGVDKFIFVQPSNGEEGFEVIRSLVATGEIGLVVWDSVATTSSLRALSKEVGSANFGSTAAIMSEGLKIVNPILSRNKVPSIFINQTRCISKDTLCLVNGKFCLFGNIKQGDSILTKKVLNTLNSGEIEGKMLSIKYRPSFYISNKHNQPVISEQGYTIMLGENIKKKDWVLQPILKNEISNNIPYVDITSHSFLATQSLPEKKRDEHFPTELTEDLAFILGAYYFDGSFREYINKKDFGISWGEYNKDRFFILKNKISKVFKYVSINEKFNQIGLFGKSYWMYFKGLGCNRYGKNKNIPDCIINSRFSVIASFIRGCFFDTHGFTSEGFIFSNDNIDSLKQFSTILYYMGIFADIRKHYLFITGGDAVRFNELIGFEEPRKNKIGVTFVSEKNARGKYDVVPYILGKQVFDWCRENATVTICESKYYSTLMQCSHKKLNFGRQSLIKFAVDCKINISDSIELGLIKQNRFSQIVGVEDVLIDAQDIEVEGDSLFIAEQYLTHNSKIGGMPSFGPQDNMKVGGYALPFYSSWVSKVSRVEGIMDKKQEIGTVMKVKNTKSKIGIPRRSVNLDLYFTTGFNPDNEYIDFIINLGYVNKGGAWLSNEEWGMKVQGRDGLLNWLKAKPDLFEELKHKINQSFISSVSLDSLINEEDDEDIESADPLLVDD